MDEQILMRVYKNNAWTEIRTQMGKSVLAALRENGIVIHSPCGGNGTCGKCKVRLEGCTEALSPNESKLLNKDEIQEGIRLACMVKAQEGIEVILEEQAGAAQIQVEGKRADFYLQPLVRKKYIELKAPSLDDQRSDVERILDSLEEKDVQIAFGIMKNLPDILCSADYKVTVVLDVSSREVTGVEAGNTTSRAFGIAVDIGTTTVVGYLLNMATGERVDVYSVLNPQRAFGGDVISRINHTIQEPEGLAFLQKEITRCIDEMVENFCTKNRIRREEIYMITFAGNTTMIHFLMALPAAGISVVPFTAVSTMIHKIKALTLNIHINPESYIAVLPSVSGYVGADTVAAVLASGMNRSEDLCLLVDIGTNGEIVLGNREMLVACSTAAGPAFEGAHIRNGIGGVAGAINYLSIENEVKYSTIGNRKATGICGSGIIDAVSALLEKSLLDETGRLLDADELEGSISDNIISRFADIDGANGFILVDREKSGIDREIAITQRDIREVQLAKGAIAAGIKILAKNAGVELGKISKVYLAGGFGSYIDKESAVKIGLIPRELDGKLEAIGNAAGSGAVMALLSLACFDETREIKSKVKYIELSSCPEFQDEFVESMMFYE